MMLAGTALASSALASQTGLSTIIDDPLVLRPIDVTINGVSWRTYIQVNTISIDDTLGEQTSCLFTIINPLELPEVGDVVEVWYYAEGLFSGTIDRIVRRVNNTQTARAFECTCTDWSQVLIRRIIRRNFSNLSIQNLCDSLISNELAGEGLTFGTADKATAIPLIDSRSGRIFDVLRDAAGVTGQTFYVDFNKQIQFRATTNAAAPLDLDLTTLEAATITMDRETYRNVQTVIVTGTPPDSSTDPSESTIIRQNDAQIAERAALEGGTGRYEMIEEITHPSSNDGVDCQLLAIGYATLRLAVSGLPRQTLNCRVRGYGFRSGQFASLDVPTLDVSGTWLIQRTQMTEQDGNKLIYELELVQSSLQQRAYESWLTIVQAGKLVVQMPSAITTNSVTFNTPGADSWTVPAGVTVVQITCKGGGGGGGGPNTYDYVGSGVGANGGAGGASGKAVTILTVVEGQELDITVGSGGLGAVNRLWTGSGLVQVYGYDGDPGTATYVQLAGSVKCQGNGGGGGSGGDWIYPLGGGGGPGTSGGAYWFAGTTGIPGGGVGDAISVGGGSTNAAGGLWTNGSDGADGLDGEVTIAW